MAQGARMNCFIGFVAALVIWTAGCGKDSGQATKAVAPQAVEAPKGRPQPRLATIKLWLGPKEITAEKALAEDEIRTGMMFRTEMAEHEGMLFAFGGPMKASFWMRNTLIPMTCAYIDPDGVILEIRDMKPLDETPIEAATDRVQFVLEMKQGWFERNKVTVGMTVATERGSLRETDLRE